MHDPRSSRADEASEERDLHERVGYVRCQLDEARARLRDLERTRDDLQRRGEEMRRQMEFVGEEVRALRGDLADRLGAWCALDELDQRTVSTDFIRKVDAVRTSITYRVTAFILKVVNKVRRIVTLQWLRSAKAS